MGTRCRAFIEDGLSKPLMRCHAAFLVLAGMVSLKKMTTMVFMTRLQDE